MRAGVTALLLLATAATAADEVTRARVEPIVTRRHFSELITGLGLSREQRTLVDFLYDDYAADIDDLVDATDRAADHAGRARVEAALAGRARVQPDDLRAMRAAVERAYAESWPMAEALMVDLVLSLELQLVDEQVDRLEPALRRLRRQTMLHPRQIERRDPQYAGDGLDLLEVIAAAQRRGGELEGAGGAALDRLGADYELALDTVIDQYASAWREGRLALRLARIARNDEAIRLAERSCIESWSALHHLNQRTADAVADLLTGVDRERWLDRFDEATFPWFVTTSRTDRAIAWMRREVGEAGIRDQAESIYADYRAKQRAARRETIRIMLGGRLDLYTFFHPMMEPIDVGDGDRWDLFEAFLKNSRELESLESEACGAMEALLPVAQRKALRQASRSVR